MVLCVCVCFQNCNAMFVWVWMFVPDSEQNLSLALDSVQCYATYSFRLVNAYPNTYAQHIQQLQTEKSNQRDYYHMHMEWEGGNEQIALAYMKSL